MRLQKYLAISGVASRRKAEEIIKSGRVKVNGIVITEMGVKVTDSDKIELDNTRLHQGEKIYIVLNKPPDVICSHKDNWNRKTIYDIIKIKKVKLFSVGRLDNKSSGIIILTNDGDFANKLIHPSNGLIKEYLVEAYELIPDILINKFKNGISIDNVTYKAYNIKRTNKQNIIQIYLQEGKKREIREVFKYFKINIKMLKRIALGNMRLENIEIKEGQYKEFTFDEINNLIFGDK